MVKESGLRESDKNTSADDKNNVPAKITLAKKIFMLVLREPRTREAFRARIKREESKRKEYRDFLTHQNERADV